jgi:hypothetical protein
MILMERLYITKENFSYLTSILNYADFLYALVQESTQNPYVVVNSVIPDPFIANGEAYLQHNQVVVNHIFKLVMTYYIKAARITPDANLIAVMKNIYLKVLDTEHDFTLTEVDLQFCSVFADFLFKYRTRLVNIGEQVIVGDLFANILARIHITLEVIMMIEDMKREEETRQRLAEPEPAEL